MVKLDSSQLGDVVLPIFGTESVVDGGCRKDCSCDNGTSGKLVVLAGDGGQGKRVENGHEVGREERMERAWGIYTPSALSGAVEGP